MSINISSSIVSKLGSPDSRIPLAIKDIFNSAGYTYFSYDAGGSVEGKDRLVDEVGTGALWLFGIPAYKKLIDKTVFKKAGISPNVDFRIVKDKAYLDKALENAPTKKIFDELQKASENVGKTRGLTLLKFALSIGLTMLSYYGLTKFKQHMTKKNIEKEFLAKQELLKTNKNNSYPQEEQNQIFKDIENFSSHRTKNPSFGSGALIKAAEDVVLNPIKNMMVLDACISGQRLTNSRTKVEFGEYAIKEGSFLFFVYGADKLIRKGLETISQKLLKTPITMDAKFISSNLSNKLLSDKTMQEEVKEFCTKIGQGSSSEIYEFIFKNQNNAAVKAAKESGLISTIEDAAGKLKIDTRKYIDIKKLKKFSENITDFVKSGTESGDINTYLKKVKALKVGATVINIGLCCLSLGYIVPKIMQSYRKAHQNGDNSFHVKAEYEKELKEKHSKTL